LPAVRRDSVRNNVNIYTETPCILNLGIARK